MTFGGASSDAANIEDTAFYGTFGLCSLLNNQPCIPKLVNAWAPGASATKVGVAKALRVGEDYLRCENGGLVVVVAAQQSDVEEKGFREKALGFAKGSLSKIKSGALYVWDDGWVILDAAMIAGDVLTVPSGEAAAGIAARRGMRQAVKNATKKQSTPTPVRTGAGKNDSHGRKIKPSTEERLKALDDEIKAAPTKKRRNQLKKLKERIQKDADSKSKGETHHRR